MCELYIICCRLKKNKAYLQKAEDIYKMEEISSAFFVEKSLESFFTGFDLLVLFEVRREWCENVRETYGEILCNF